MALYFRANVQRFMKLSVSFHCGSLIQLQPLLFDNFEIFGIILYIYDLKRYVQCLGTLLPGWTVINLTVVMVMAPKIVTVYKDQSSKYNCNVYIDAI